METKTKSIILKEGIYIEGKTLEIKKIGDRCSIICDGKLIARTKSEIFIDYWQDLEKNESYFNYTSFKKWGHQPAIFCIDTLNMEVYITGADVHLDSNSQIRIVKNKRIKMTYKELKEKYPWARKEELEEIKLGLERGIDVSIYANRFLYFEQMKPTGYILYRYPKYGSLYNWS